MDRSHNESEIDSYLNEGKGNEYYKWAIIRKPFTYFHCITTLSSTNGMATVLNAANVFFNRLSLWA